MSAVPAKSVGKFREGNRAAIRSGTYAFLSTGRLPKGASFVSRLLGELRRALEEACQAAHGSVSLSKACIIQSICRHEAQCLLLQRWLRKGEASMSTDQRLAHLRQVGNATEARDRAVKSLALDRNVTEDVWAAIYAKGGLPAVIIHADAPAGLPGPFVTEELAAK